MKQYAYIEWRSFILPETIVGDVDAALDDHAESDTEADETNPFAASEYRWLVCDGEFTWQQAQQGNSDELLAWLSSHPLPIVFCIPGDQVVVRQVPYHEREKRHFSKTLPYVLEDSIIDDVDELHFAVGQKTEGQATIAYINKTWFEQALNFFEAHHYHAERSIIDFQCLPCDNKATLWFTDERLLARRDDGTGFSASTHLAPQFLSAMVDSGDAETTTVENDTNSYTVYVGSDAGRSDHSTDKAKHTLHTLAPHINSEYHAQPPALQINNPDMINFCSGDYAAKKTSSNRHRYGAFIGGLGVVALLLFFISNGVDIYLTKQKITAQEQQTEAVVRKVIPEGVIRDPIRSLTSRLEKISGGGDARASQVVHLLSKIAPVIQSLNIDLLTINYKHKEQTLRMSVQADAFNTVQELKERIEKQGFTAELVNSNSVDDKFQARLRIRPEGL